MDHSVSPAGTAPGTPAATLRALLRDAEREHPELAWDEQATVWNTLQRVDERIEERAR